MTGDPPRRPPRSTPGLVLAALALGGFAIGTTEFASMSLLPYFAKDLGVDAPTAGHAISAYALGVVVGAPVIAVLAARLPRRIILVALMAVFAVGNLLSALARRASAGCSPSGSSAACRTGPISGSRPWSPPASRRPSARPVGGHGDDRPDRGDHRRRAAGQCGRPVDRLALGLRDRRRAGRHDRAVGLSCYARARPADADASPLRELGALAKGRVWLTLGIGAIGFGGMFCVYTYLASTCWRSPTPRPPPCRWCWRCSAPA
jgi:DHA1 family inner membrane transport protein